MQSAANTLTDEPASKRDERDTFLLDVAFTSRAHYIGLLRHVGNPVETTAVSPPPSPVVGAIEFRCDEVSTTVKSHRDNACLATQTRDVAEKDGNARRGRENIVLHEQRAMTNNVALRIVGARREPTRFNERRKPALFCFIEPKATKREIVRGAPAVRDVN